MAHLYEGSPDGRQSDDPHEAVSLFRPRYRALSDEEKALHDRIKAKAEELWSLFREVGKTAEIDHKAAGAIPLADASDRYALRRESVTLARIHLEDAVYRAVKALTG